MTQAHEQALFTRGFTRAEHAFQGAVRDVYRRGSGPAIILLSELPGITPQTLDLAERLCGAGYSVALPQLFGDPGRPMSGTYIARSFARACVTREFSVLASQGESPIADWLRSLARAEHVRAGGPGVGVIGMCFTGGFALGMMLEPVVLASVMSQPSLPVGASKSVGLDDAQLSAIRARLEREDRSVMALRFTGDVLCPGDRFETLRRVLGDRFIAVEIDSRPGNAHGIKRRAHSVLTLDFVDRPGHPTADAMSRVLSFFDHALGQHHALPVVQA